MKRFHVHVSVDDLARSIAFYSGLFGTPPSVRKPDYAKWMLDDPRVNFAISRRGRAAGLDHLGLQVDSADELGQVRDRLVAAEAGILDQAEASCCYARSDKHWTLDPQGIAWETFHSLAEIPVYGGDSANLEAVERSEAGSTSCCTPDQATRAKAATSACCG